MKRDELALTCTPTWTDLKNIIFGEKGKVQNNMIPMISVV